MKERKPWTTHEVRYLQTHYPQRSQLQIAMQLRRSVDSVKWKTIAMGLKTHRKAFWTTREIRYVEEHRDQPYKALAQALGRGYHSVKAMANRLHLKSRHDQTAME